MADDFEPLSIPAVMPRTVRRVDPQTGLPSKYLLDYEEGSHAWMKANVANTNTRLSIVSDQIGDVSASVVTLAQAQATLEGAFASYQVTVTAQFGAVNARVDTETTARATADSALASQITTVDTKVGNNTAAISAEITARTNGDSALASQITSLTTTVNANTAAISNEATARSNGDSALATQISTVDAKANAATASGQIYFEAKAAPAGATASFGLFLTAGTEFAGFEVIADSSVGSAIGMSADRFFFYSGSGANRIQALAYDGSTWVLNGNVVIRSGTSGARQVITSENTKIYDAVGTLRVAIGVNI